VSAVARLGFLFKGRSPSVLALLLAAAVVVVPRAGHAQDHGAAADDSAAAAPADTGDTGYTPPVGSTPALQLNGYVDVGFAKAQGDGSSFAPGDLRLPVDYAVDTFAPAVNSRGDVASNDAGGRLTNGFLPRSVGIGGRPSFLLNTVDFDFKYIPPGGPLLIFSRLQLLPRFSSSGDETHALLEQAFARLIPFDSQELAISVGKFDSVFGIEYLDNQANIRTGVTPSLMARYTTGVSIGAKVFYRIQIPALWSAVSVHVAATNSGTFVEALQSPDASLTGRPVLSGRLGYELNLPAVQIKLGASGSYGPRNDQNDRDAHQRLIGADARIAFFGIYLSGEYLSLMEEEGGPKFTGMGMLPISSGFHAQASYAQAAYALPIDVGPWHKLTVYGRYDRRHAYFGGFTAITVDRITGGLRLDLWDAVIVKGEVLVNRELAGAPTVPNNVYTSSFVYSW
jgi:hypothetical protein